MPVPQLRCKFQVSTFSRFKVIAFFIFVYELVKYAGKNTRTRGSSNKNHPATGNTKSLQYIARLPVEQYTMSFSVYTWLVITVQWRLHAIPFLPSRR